MIDALHGQVEACAVGGELAEHRAAAGADASLGQHRVAGRIVDEHLA